MRIQALAVPVALVMALTVTGTSSASLDVHNGRFDQPRYGFAPPDTALRPGSPDSAGLDPGPIDAYLERLARWEDPANGAGYLFPGATALMAHDGVVVSRSASGYAVKYADANTELPRDQWIPARTDTIYDLASLSKLFTSIVAVQQIEAGRLDLDATVASYIPEFAVNDKAKITVEQLLTHTSGLPADPSPPLWQAYPDIASREKAILDTKPINPAGTTYLYSDLNMLSMQLVLRRVTGEPLDALVRKGITGPLHMVDTGYNPPPEKLTRIAATEYQVTPARGMLRGSVHDENAWAMGGVAGHAGVFSTVDDLAVLAQAILNGGTYGGNRILSEQSVRLLETNFNQNFPGDAHGLGFELDQIWYMGGLSSPSTVGHTGYTGTSIVIDPQSRSFAILLTNRVHPTRNTPSTNPARETIATALAQSMHVLPPGGGRSWFASQPGGTTSTLTSIPLPTHGVAEVSFLAFVNTEPTDVLALQESTDGGSTWQPAALTVQGPAAPVGTTTTLSGQATRAWWFVRATLAAAPAGVVLRWSYATDPLYEGRGVNLAHLRVADSGSILLDSDRDEASLTSAGWRELTG
ncbi:MAG: serine hydrolase [Kutzneria sp.]|nr:serine hydrolase [Kutzneria sp.]MBV9845707.1 serine hydrolase [Kutzneria sp.]